MDEMAQLECTVLASTGEGLVVTEGHADLVKAPILENCLRDLGLRHRVAVDLAGVTVMDAQSLPRLLGCARRRRKQRATR